MADAAAIQINIEFQNNQYIKICSTEMDWNQMSDDSWLQDDSSESEDNHKSEEPTLTTKVDPTEPQPSMPSTSSESKNVQVKPKEEVGEKPRQQKKQGRKQSRKFPTDLELLEQYRDNKIQQNTRIKVINFSQDERKTIDTLLKEKKIKKVRAFRENILIVTFWNKEDLIKFIEKKIDSCYKFKLGIYVVTQQEKQWRIEKLKQRNQVRAKEDRKEERQAEHKQQKYKKTEYRGKNEEEVEKKEDEKKEARKKKDEEDRRQKEKEKKQHNKPKQEHRQESKPEKVDHRYKEKEQEKKSKLAKNLQLQSQRSNKIIVLSDDSTPAEAAEWIKSKQIPKQFNEFVLIAPGELVDYMDRISQECHRTFKYGLTSDISEEDCQRDPKAKFEYKFGADKKPKPIKRCVAGVFIWKAGQEYFEAFQKFNTHILGERDRLSQVTEFDEKDYIQCFKKNYPKLVGKWEKWVLYAYGKNVAKLLRLSGTIRKLLDKNQFLYELGVQDKLPFLRFEITDFNKTKYKVDTSVVNSHLQEA